MKRQWLWVRVCVLAASLALVASGARAAESTSAAIDHDKQRVVDAENEVTGAQKALETLSVRLRQEFESSPEWTDADSALKQARTEHDAAVAPVLAALRQKPEYQSAVDQKTKSAAESDKLRGGGTASADELAAASKKSMEASKAVAQMESDAIAADAGAREATAKLNDALARVAALKQKSADSIKTNTEFVRGREKLDHARAKRDKAQIALNEAVKREQAKEQAVQEHRNRRRR